LQSEPEAHILINGLSIGSGGGFTVGRELFRGIATARPNWLITLVLIRGNRLHEELESSSLPSNCRILWAPPTTQNRFKRSRYERGPLVQWIHDNHADAVLQLNGMLIPGLQVPSLCHMQDPWPYRPEAWTGAKQRAIAWLKRRAHRRVLKQAAVVGWTSAYLRDVITGYHRITPARSEVFYNGIPDEWIGRAQSASASRETSHRIITVSNVTHYKRQDVVVRALALLRRRPGLQDLTYQIVGQPTDGFDSELRQLARSLHVEEQVKIEGRVDEQRLAECWREAGCFVLMSVCESFGIPAVEAMSFGVPVVTSDCCAMPEVCGDAAALSPVDDAEALADRIERVLKDPDYAQQLRRNGFRQVEKFRWGITAEKMALAMEKILAPSQEVSAT